MYINRKLALEKAIEALTECPMTPELKQVIKRLQEMQLDKRVVGIQWTKQMVFDKLDEWKEQHGRNPRSTDLIEDGMPKDVTIKTLFDMRTAAFLNVYYPPEIKKKAKGKYSRKPTSLLLEEFVNQFNELQPCSAKDYNNRREAGTPTWETVARRLQCPNWSDLLKLAEVDTKCLKHNQTPPPRTYIVDSTNSLYEKQERLFKNMQEWEREFVERMAKYKGIV